MTVGTVPLLLPTATRCRGCGARVRWFSGCLLDAEPAHDGRYELVLADGHWTAIGKRPYRALELRRAGRELYGAHRCR